MIRDELKGTCRVPAFVQSELKTPMKPSSWFHNMMPASCLAIEILVSLNYSVTTPQPAIQNEVGGIANKEKLNEVKVATEFN
eukprot:2391271-Amphidinium_carterae.1